MNVDSFTFSHSTAWEIFPCILDARMRLRNGRKDVGKQKCPCMCRNTKSVSLRVHPVAQSVTELVLHKVSLYRCLTAMSAQEKLPLYSSDAQGRKRDGIKTIAQTGLFASQHKQNTHTHTRARIDAHRNNSHPSSSKQNLYRQRNAA